MNRAGSDPRLKVMVLGGGAREHALAARIARSPRLERLVCVPGNGGTAAIAENVAADPEDTAAMVALARRHAIDFVVVGPEAPLCAGVVDALAEAGIEAFGAHKRAARLEGSKAFSKRFMQRHGVPTAGAAIFEDAGAATAYARAAGKPLVVKADGLAAGKGVIVAGSVDETIDAIDRVMRKREFGEAGASIVLEELLVGEEVSFHVLVDGERGVPLVAAQDHKRLLDADRGPNTGGMGAYSPPPVVTAELERKILDRVVEPTLQGLRADGLGYRGVLFIGLMIVGGEPYVLEYNTRFGDPETQVLTARFDGDLLALFLAAARAELDSVPLDWKAKTAMSVVIAAPGYPGAYSRGLPIAGLVEAEQIDGVTVQHAGTRLDGDRIVTAGGRVLSVTAAGPDLDSVAERVYAAVSRIDFEGMQYRRDIGWRARAPR
jgi:phosphoribosylamine---glycine ligase